jgi:VIT1/CCC1 family predicted Fe2+/Mn2+ transporter
MTNKKARDSWYEEMRSSYLYQQLSDDDGDQTRKALFMRLSEEAIQQADSWAAMIGLTNEDKPLKFKPDARTKIVGWLIKRFGANNIKPVLAAIKIRGLSLYSNNRLIGYHPVPEKVEQIGGSHSGVSNTGSLRAAVFGVNDGLVSIACLLMGVAGAATNTVTIIIAGVAGLLAGAFSMASGEYVSMRSQREMFEYQIGLERDELAQYPEEEAGELALIYIARGMEPDDAQKLANKLVADPDLGLDTLAREELGLNPDELGSPFMAACSSFIAFIVGGSIPLLPYLLGLSGALKLSIVLTGLSLFAIGAILSLFTGRNALLGGLRMFLIGGGAGVMTYWIGHLMGASAT